MPYAKTDDGVKLYYEETGTGTPVVFVHEFAGDHRSWEPQMRHFGQRYRCITYSARGYPPSDVPEDAGELLAGPRRRRHPRGARSPRRSTRRTSSACRWAASPRCISASAIRRARCSLVVAGVRLRRRAGPAARSSSGEVEAIAESHARARAWRSSPAKYAYGPTRVQFENKDPRGFAEFKKRAGRAFGAGLGQHHARRAGASGPRSTT